MARIEVKMDIKQVENVASEYNLMRGRFALGNQMIADMDRYVPRLSGDLRTAVSLSTNADEIYYSMPYATKQFTTQFRNYTAPGTGPRWDKKALGIHGKSWVQAFVKGADL